VIERAHQNGVTRMMTVGVNKKTAVRAVSLAESHRDLYASVGFHPHDAEHCHSAALDFLITLAGSPKVRAWGEIGLDYNRMYSPREDQERWFIRQLEIAAELSLPMIFHERDSKGRFLDILKAHLDKEQTGVIHCFSGNTDELQQYLGMGLYIGITGILTLKSRGAKLRRMVTQIPSDRLLVETDAPYLTPAPEKNHTRRNEPAFVKPKSETRIPLSWRRPSGTIRIDYIELINRRQAQTHADTNLTFSLADPAKEKQHALRAKK
jgi:TatD DNase family protein